MFNLLRWIESDSPAPLMLQIPPYARGMEPDPEAVERRQARVDALIQQMGPKWVGHPQHQKGG